MPLIGFHALQVVSALHLYVIRLSVVLSTWSG
jgi:hypothetical protein